MDTATLLALLASCAPLVAPATAQALIQVESAANPWAIGVVGGALIRQPRTQSEAVATAQALQAQGWNFSVGLAQINRHNFQRLGLDLQSAFEPCANLAAMEAVLEECFQRALNRRAEAPQASPEQTALRRALSCYYSGNFSTGFRHGYVAKVQAAVRADTQPAATPPMPAAGLSAAPQPRQARTAKEPS